MKVTSAIVEAQPFPVVAHRPLRFERGMTIPR